MCRIEASEFSRFFPRWSSRPWSGRRASSCTNVNEPKASPKRRSRSSYAHWKKVAAYQRPDAWVRRVAIQTAVRAAGGNGVGRRLERRRTARGGGGAGCRSDPRRSPAASPTTGGCGAVLFRGSPAGRDRAHPRLHRVDGPGAPGESPKAIGRPVGRGGARCRRGRDLRDSFKRLAGQVESDIPRHLDQTLRLGRRRTLMRRTARVVAVAAATATLVLAGPATLRWIDRLRTRTRLQGPRHPRRAVVGWVGDRRVVTRS